MGTKYDKIPGFLIGARTWSIHSSLDIGFGAKNRLGATKPPRLLPKTVWAAKLAVRPGANAAPVLRSAGRLGTAPS